MQSRGITLGTFGRKVNAVLLESKKYNSHIK